jgi:hypothetical protein
MKGIASKRKTPARKKASSRRPQMTRELAEKRAIRSIDGRKIDAVGFLRTLKK